jgi:hypothetical protein
MAATADSAMTAHERVEAHELEAMLHSTYGPAVAAAFHESALLLAGALCLGGVHALDLTAVVCGSALCVVHYTRTALYIVYTHEAPNCRGIKHELFATIMKAAEQQGLTTASALSLRRPPVASKRRCLHEAQGSRLAVKRHQASPHTCSEPAASKAAPARPALPSTLKRSQPVTARDPEEQPAVKRTASEVEDDWLLEPD